LVFSKFNLGRSSPQWRVLDGRSFYEVRTVPAVKSNQSLQRTLDPSAALLPQSAFRLKGS
jgi:hypothetical protein